MQDCKTNWSKRICFVIEMRYCLQEKNLRSIWQIQRKKMEKVYSPQRDNLSAGSQIGLPQSVFHLKKKFSNSKLNPIFFFGGGGGRVRSIQFFWGRHFLKCKIFFYNCLRKNVQNFENTQIHKIFLEVYKRRTFCMVVRDDLCIIFFVLSYASRTVSGISYYGANNHKYQKGKTTAMPLRKYTLMPVFFNYLFYFQVMVKRSRTMTFSSFSLLFFIKD